MNQKAVFNHPPLGQIADQTCAQRWLVAGSSKPLIHRKTARRFLAARLGHITPPPDLETEKRHISGCVCRYE
jgi:hypothetical protein